MSDILDAVRKMRDHMSSCQEVIDFLLWIDEGALYIKGEHDTNWVVLKYQSTSSNYVGTGPRGESLYMIRDSVFKVMACGPTYNNPYSMNIDCQDTYDMRKLHPDEWPLFLSGFVDPEFSQMIERH
jgi:hypothetical protein